MAEERREAAVIGMEGVVVEEDGVKEVGVGDALNVSPTGEKESWLPSPPSSMGSCSWYCVPVSGVLRDLRGFLKDNG